MKEFIKVVLMAKDELGDDFRVNSEVYTIPSVVYNDSFLMSAWEADKIRPYHERFPEAYNFHFERPFSDYSYWELEEIAQANPDGLDWMN